jgi:hypothetical protein
MSSPLRLDVFALAPEVRGHQVRDVQEAVAAETEIDERRLDARLDVGDPAFVNVPDVGSGAGPLHVKFFEFPVVQQGDSALLALADVDQHFLGHAELLVDSG